MILKSVVFTFFVLNIQLSSNAEGRVIHDYNSAYNKTIKFRVSEDLKVAFDRISEDIVRIQNRKKFKKKFLNCKDIDTEDPGGVIAEATGSPSGSGFVFNLTEASRRTCYLASIKKLYHDYKGDFDTKSFNLLKLPPYVLNSDGMSDSTSEYYKNSKNVGSTIEEFLNKDKTYNTKLKSIKGLRADFTSYYFEKTFLVKTTLVAVAVMDINQNMKPEVLVLSESTGGSGGSAGPIDGFFIVEIDSNGKYNIIADMENKPKNLCYVCK